MNDSCKNCGYTKTEIDYLIEKSEGVGMITEHNTSFGSIVFAILELDERLKKIEKKSKVKS
jgi:hypothetical protein